MEYIKDLCGFPGFRAQARVKKHPFNPEARIVVLKRRQKKRPVPVVALLSGASGAGETTGFVTWMSPLRRFTWSLSTDGYSVRGAGR